MDFDRVDRNIVLLWIDWGLNHLPGILKVAFRSSLINALHQRSLRVSEQCQTQLPSRSVSHQKSLVSLMNLQDTYIQDVADVCVM